VVALPLWFATGSRTRVLVLTLLNGFMEPIGVIFAYFCGGFILIKGPDRIQRMLCGVAGVMSAIAFGELLPNSVSWMKKGSQNGGDIDDFQESDDSGVSGGKRLNMRWIYVRVGIWCVFGIIFGWIVLTISDMVLNSLDLD
jgi:hypothetical protein